MKHKHMFSLLDQTFTTVHVSFTPELLSEQLPPGEYEMSIDEVTVNRDRRGRSSLDMQFTGRVLRGQTYVYKVPKAWKVEERDHLVVLSPRDGLKVVTVVKVDIAPDIDVDANHDYKWAVCKVDLSEFQELTLKEKQFGETMLEIERVKQRESLVASFRESLPEGSAARQLFEQTTQTLAPPQAPPSAPQS